MATQAVKSGQYHAGVLLHKLLVKQSLKEEHEGDIRHRYFNELPITHHKAKVLCCFHSGYNESVALISMFIASLQNQDSAVLSPGGPPAESIC